MKDFRFFGEKRGEFADVEFAPLNSMTVDLDSIYSLTRTNFMMRPETFQSCT